MIKRNKSSKAKSTLLLFSLLWGIQGCSKSPSPPRLEDGQLQVVKDVMRGKGTIKIQSPEVQDQFSFQALISPDKRLILEGKKMGFVGLVYRYIPGEARMVIPREKNFWIKKTWEPLAFLQGLGIKDDVLFAALRFDLQSLIDNALSIQTEGKYTIYQHKDDFDVYVNSDTKRMHKLLWRSQDLMVHFGAFENAFPSTIHIKSGRYHLNWVWKKIETNTAVGNEVFDLPIPQHFSPMVIEKPLFEVLN